MRVWCRWGDAQPELRISSRQQLRARMREPTQLVLKDKTTPDESMPLRPRKLRRLSATLAARGHRLRDEGTPGLWATVQATWVPLRLRNGSTVELGAVCCAQPHASAGSALKVPTSPLCVVRASRTQNEVVLDAEAWEAALPDTIHAFFFVDGGSGETSSGGLKYDESAMRRVHKNFLRAYSRSAAECPLLRLTPEQWDAPFALA